MCSSTTRSVLVLEAPGEIVRQQRRHLAGGPSEKVTVRVGRGPRDQTVVSRPRVRGVERARCRRRIDPDIGVVHDSRIAGPEFEAADEARAIDRDRQHEDMKCVGPFRRQRVRLRQRNDEIRLPKLPPVGPMHCGLRIADCGFGGGWVFRRSSVRPTLEQRDFAGAQRMLADERAIARIGLPRRHEALRRHLRDLRGVPFRVRVREQAERR